HNRNCTRLMTTFASLLARRVPSSRIELCVVQFRLCMKGASNFPKHAITWHSQEQIFKTRIEIRWRELQEQLDGSNKRSLRVALLRASLEPSFKIRDIGNGSGQYPNLTGSRRSTSCYSLPRR